MSEPCCPRCGYDLTGLIDTWREACPLEVTCAECGLGVEPRFILNPGLLRQWRFFEFAEHRRAASFVRTALLTLRPRRFWKWVRLEFPFRPGRAAAVVIVLALLIVAFAVVVHAGRWIATDLRNPYWASLGGRNSSWLAEWWFFRKEEVCRGVFTLGQENPVTYGYDLIGPRGSAVLLAWALMPLGFVALPDTLRRARVRHAHILRIWVYSVPGMVLCAELAPVVEAVVNWPLSWMYGWSVSGPGGTWASGGPWPEVSSSEVAPVLSLAWLVLWWWRATRHYLRLPHALAVSAVLLATSMLAAVVVLLVAAGAWFLAWM